MKISINGTPTTTELSSLADIIAEFGAKEPYALAINGEFVAKSEYEQTQVGELDKIDIVSPVFGG